MNFIEFFNPIAHAHEETDFFGHHMFDGMGVGFGGFFGILFFWLVIIVVVVIVIQAVTKSKSRKEKDKTALDILKERYAKGEIDKKEYEEKRKELIK